MLHGKNVYALIIFACLTGILTGCREKAITLLSAIPAKQAGINFQNTIHETEDNNIMTYQYLYNGAGVAVGDINNDGLPDIYLCANAEPNKLFLNKGGFKFQDITNESKLQDRAGDWKTGVTMVDINGDGWLDMYVCYSGNAPGEGFNKPVISNNTHRSNQLFINQGCEKGKVPQFVESAASYGLDAPGTFSTQAYFFDYDNDGDLDMFLLNHANTFYSTFFNTTRLRNARHPYFGNRLYRNDSLKFTDVSEAAHIYGSGLNFGLSVAVSDLNNDGWADMYVTNDYDEQDFCYLNKKDGTFEEVSHQAFGHLSKFGMGTDAADVNNDQLTDIFVADMLPPDNYRQKLLKPGDQYDKYYRAVDSGLHYQNMRNTFQVNAGVGEDGIPLFRELGQQAGISNTDWSWGPLFADIDNDGWKDLIVTNGYLHDYTNMDFLKYMAEEVKQPDEQSMMKLVEKMPSTKLHAYAFRNKGGWEFEDNTMAWGLTQQSISNGIAYADFDNDGDLDFITNRINEEPGIYQNQTEQLSHANYIKIKLKGEGLNSFGTGSKVWIKTDHLSIYQEAFFTRGYESSVEPILNIGLGKDSVIREIKIQWPDKKITSIKNVKPNQLVIAEQQKAVDSPINTPAAKPFFVDYTSASGINFIHQENDYVDFRSERLLPYQLSRLGGKMAVADVNGDGNDDIFFCGAAGQAGELFIGKDDGSFSVSSSQPWQADGLSEDINELFFDADNDGDKDLYVVSGGNEFKTNDSLYHDRLYINKGNAVFEKNTEALPVTERNSGSCVTAADFDRDGDLDLFVGSRLIPHQYPGTPQSILLRNESKNGKVAFTDITASVATLQACGMVTDACWLDIDKDGWQDLIVCGDWMPVKFFKNNNGKGFTDVSASFGITSASGWWTKIITGDFDNDGDTDLVMGNAGKNLQIKVSATEPAEYFLQDINKDVVPDPIICYYTQGKLWPLPGFDEITEQVPGLKKKFFKYADYATAGIDDIIGEKTKPYLSVNNLQSCFFRNDGPKFTIIPLPSSFQSSMLQAFVFDDFGTGKKDILCAGNFYPYNVEWGKSDSFFGGLINCSSGSVIETKLPGTLFLPGDIRDMKKVVSKSGKNMIIVSRNNDKASLYTY